MRQLNRRRCVLLILAAAVLPTICGRSDARLCENDYAVHLDHGAG